MIGDLIHYSDKPLKNIRSSSQEEIAVFSKPNGLWLSVGEAWKDWCEGKSFRLEYLKSETRVSVKERVNILSISTESDLLNFSTEYCSSESILGLDKSCYCIDWKRVSKEYQGIVISPYQWKCRLGTETMWYYPWDCACACIWDSECLSIG
jgi:hypothetical protein